jgi:ATP-dependent DNA ligase
VDLPVMPPVKPMLAKAIKGVPEADSVDGGLLFEPKWDGFRCIVFRDGDEVVLGSRNEKPLTRYFPEVVAAILEQFPERCVVDGEIVIASGATLDFDALLNRIHPAESRVRRLAGETPAAFVAFDLLALGDDDVTGRPFGERRALLEGALADATAPVFLTPATGDSELARSWFSVFEGAGLDGVVAKPLALPYRQNDRVMFKIKHLRTADCAVAGFRWHTSGPVVGSLLLGLYDDDGHLQHVGVCGAFTAARRAELVKELEPYRTDTLDGHPWAAWSSSPGGQPDGGAAPAAPEAGAPERRPGATSRWNANKDLSWVPLRVELVAEVSYDHMAGTRFRHTAQFRNWRPDREPASCTYAQLEQIVRFDLATVLAGG